MLHEKTWDEFAENGLLWFVNRILHLFGWAITLDVVDGVVTKAYPARTNFRGFDEDTEQNGYYDLTKYLKHNINDLLEDCAEEEAPPYIIMREERSQGEF